MDINLRLPSGDNDKEEDEPNGFVNMLDSEEKPPLSIDGVGGDMADDREKLQAESGEDMNSIIADIEYVTNLEPLPGMEFGSHGDAYTFYQEYAGSVGFNTAIQNSRRSKISREFIDAKFACSRYGTKREYEKSLNRARSRQGSNQDQENATGRRPCSKTDCKASMHVKRRLDGKWIIHRFEKEHNHELLPAQAISEQTRRMYAAMARQFAEYKSAVGLKDDFRSPSDKCRNMALEVGEMRMLLELLIQMQSLNPNFFYAVDVGEDQCLKTVFWVDAKSRHDYVYFNDVVSFDTTYIKNKYKMPLSLFIGVNQHYQFMLLGCALVSDENTATYSWVMKTWLKAMGGLAPKIIITDQDIVMKSIISEVFPSSLHFFCLWHIMGKVSETLNHVIKQTGNFMVKFGECIYRSWTEKEFENGWNELVDSFGLKENDLIQSLYEDRTKWVPVFMKDVVLAGMSTVQRSESVNTFFDKYVHKKTTMQEFVKQYETILQERCEEEAKASSDTWNKQPVLKSPSPFEKQLAGIYTHVMFRKFQTEVLGGVACIPRREDQVDATITFKVQDFEKTQEFTVMLNEVKSEVSCMCHLFESKGFLCRHAMVVLQICGISDIPTQYILKRWTKDAKCSYAIREGSEQVQSRLLRYNDLCQRAMKLIEEGSLSQETYNIAQRVFGDAFENCLCVNKSNKNLIEAGTSTSPGLLCIEEDNLSGNLSQSNRKKHATKKRKANLEPDVMPVGTPESLQPMEKLSSRTMNLDGFFGAQQEVEGMVQLNLMAPTRDNYYGNQQTIHGLGQLNSIAPTHDGYYGNQQTIHGLGQMDFFRTPSFTYGIREECNVRSAQLHDDATRHA